MTKIPAFATVVATLGLLGVFASCAAIVWPTAYRTIPVNPGQPRILAAREHRLTGAVELLTRDGWRPARAAPPPLTRQTAGRDTADPLAGYSPDWRTAP